MLAPRIASISPLVSAGCLLSLAACSPASGIDPSGESLGTAGATQVGAGGGSAASGGSGTPPLTGAGGVFLNPLPGSGGNGAPCAANTQRGEQVVIETPVEITEEVRQPVALYFIMDESASMLPIKWLDAQASLNAFLTAPTSSGLKVALHYFSANFLPPQTCTAGLPCLGCSACDGSDCRTPLYPMGELPGNAQPITADLMARGPAGIGTPIEAALRGGTQYCTQYQTQNPNEKCVFVLITDGAPTNCSQDFAALASVAGDAFTQSGVRTFAIGMDGADFALLDAIGQAGGGDCTPNGPGFSCNARDQQAFGAALEAIRTTVVVTRTETRIDIITKPVECEYARPNPPEGKPFDPFQVNVEYVVNGQTTKLLKAPSAAQCPPEGGWFYDDDANPQKVLVCPSTCTTLQNTPNVDVNILLGCKTDEIIPR